VDRDPKAVGEFGGWTGDLQRLARWLQAGRIDTVAIPGILDLRYTT
jgi:hypothetical protein